MVENVESFETKLEIFVLGYYKALQHRRVELIDSIGPQVRESRGDCPEVIVEPKNGG
jgi:hypothetical protein